jgi:bacteriorhodopsin
MCGTLTLIVWICYPVAWGVCEGGNLIAPDSEAIFYGVLDLIAKPVFGALLLFGHRNIDPARLGLRIRDYGEDPAQHGGIVGSKAAHNGHHNGTQQAADGAGAGDRTATGAAPTTTAAA